MSNPIDSVINKTNERIAAEEVELKEHQTNAAVKLGTAIANAVFGHDYKDSEKLDREAKEEWKKAERIEAMLEGKREILAILKKERENKQEQK